MNKIFKYVVLIFVLIFSVNTYSIDSLEKEETNLYLESIKGKKNLDSITYLYNIDGVLRQDAIDFFMDFSESIGMKNGAVLIPDVYFLNEKKPKNAFLNYNVDTSYKDIIEIITNSKCDFVNKKGNSKIIYEDLKKKECFYLDVKTTPSLFGLLVDIRKIIIGNSTASEVELKRNIGDTVDVFFDKTETENGVENIIRRLVGKLFKS